MKNLLLSVIIMSLSGFFTYSITDNGIIHMALAQQDNGSTTTPPADNMTMGSNSTDMNNAPTPNDNSTGTNSVGGPPDLGLPTDNMSGNTTPQQNATAPSINSQATPEFGPIAILVLIISIVSVVVIASRNRLGFRN